MIRKLIRPLTTYAVDHPKKVLLILVLVTILALIQFPRIHIDTDPENMLPSDHPVRTYYKEIKEEFSIHDFIVLGITDAEGLFRPEALERIARIVKRTSSIPGVIIEDMVSLSTTDNIKAKDGTLDVRPPLARLPKTPEECEKLREELAKNPLLHEKIVSADGKAVAIYIPIRKKDESFRIARDVEQILQSELGPGQNYYLAGLPIAEDTFGHEMFIQMGITAPLAFMGILLLIFLMFRNFWFLIPPAMDAMFSILWTMGLLIGSGFTVHIMSSMIPIFLMPMAILSDIHILSEFRDRYLKSGNRREALLSGMEELYAPCFFTSLTTAVAFASLALANIPPVRVFGLFVAFGIVAAWLLSMTLVPAIIMLSTDKSLLRMKGQAERKLSALDRLLVPLGRFAFERSWPIIAVFCLVIGVGIWGLYRIEINDNPVRWFRESHRLRIADTAMNRLFGGTYMAYLVVETPQAQGIHDPKVMEYIAQLQKGLEKDALVGKTTSIADVVRRVNFVLHDEDPNFDAVADTSDAIAQFIFLARSSGDPTELDNLIAHEEDKANIWVQLKGGDNRDMSRVEMLVNDYVKSHPLPKGVTLHWSGLTYINKVWQQVMVWGMLAAVLGSFIWVLVLCIIEFRSLVLGVISLFPVSISIVGAYGLLGWIGKNYDMPVAVCGALALGQGIDFAIHYIERFKQRYKMSQNLATANSLYFEEPARANFRMAIVIILGFLPLLASTLTPYTTVGMFFALLMFLSASVTLVLLPALMRLIGEWCLKRSRIGLQ